MSKLDFHDRLYDLDNLREKKKLSKKEQLRKVFKAELNRFAKEIYKYEEGYGSDYLDSADIVEDSVNVLLKEVTIRTRL